MLLYLWVNNFKHIKKTGFNLSSGYEFSFILESENTTTSEIKGGLYCKKKDSPKLFDNQIVDIKAVIGENGSGKSTVIEILIQNLMTKSNIYFDGFIVTDKYVFNRKGIQFGNSINEISYFNLREVLNVELVNYNRDEFQRKLKPDEVRDSYTGQIATSHLNHLSVIHYSPLLNIDRVANIEGLAGSSKAWETNYWHYYDFTTENCIVNDYHSLNIGESNYYISGESELLAHKSLESKRNLEFLSNKIFKQLLFKNRVDEISIRLNNFYQRFWESIDNFLKFDSETYGRIQEVIFSIREKDSKSKNHLKELEENLYVSFIYGALKYEYQYRTNFGNRKKSNALFSTIDLFLSSTKRTRIHKSALEKFLGEAEFAKNLKESLFLKIKQAVDFILKSSLINDKYADGFTIPTSDSVAINKFIKLFYDDFIIDYLEEKRSFIFHIFSFEYIGLSSGEKTLLSMFSRIQNAATNIPKTQKEILFLLDEPEVTLHPQWQISFIKLLNDTLPKMFPKRNLQIIISSHSPILVSDLPKNHILFLEKDDKTGECIVSDQQSMQQTFGSNIHTLYSDSFFLKEKGGSMGEFAKGKIKEVIQELKKDFPENPDNLKSIIDLVGEPLIKNQLMDFFYKKFPEQKIDDIDERIVFLEEQLKTTLEIKNRKKNENS